ncbi:Peroxisomal membrane protein PMP22 [Vitis vinifera]|uniref:Peroxisomal membrane protein PMP22 n=1 Tax=Vitis vinifera TaxID=29760 RepID=A0A438GI15_VITVI|nr:Peroxisomal membrane protein PMP22 [Vitis vinifera]
MSDLIKAAWRNYLLQLQLHPLRTKVSSHSHFLPFKVPFTSEPSFPSCLVAEKSGETEKANLSFWAITAGVLVGCSDVIAQKISGIKRLQLRRLILMMLYGFAYSGPFGHFLHKLMDIIFRGKKDNTTVAKKVVLEQLTSSPWNNMFFMMYYGLVVEGRGWGLVKNKVRKDYPSVQLTAWKFWPIVGWVNYQYMPLQFRVVFHSFVASCWAIFLNLKARSVAIKKA